MHAAYGTTLLRASLSPPELGGSRPEEYEDTFEGHSVRPLAKKPPSSAHL